MMTIKKLALIPIALVLLAFDATVVVRLISHGWPKEIAYSEKGWSQLRPAQIQPMDVAIILGLLLAHYLVFRAYPRSRTRARKSVEEINLDIT